jgi:membrane protein YqaA with SNARE-associated domain
MYCLGSAVFPLLHAEAYLITVSALTSPALSWALVLAGTAGQMAGKIIMYGAGRGALRLPGERLHARLAAAAARYEGHRKLGNALIFLSASAGLPPFFVISVVAGMVRAPLTAFIVFGFLGRFLRFTVAVFLPHLIMRWV